VQLALGQRALVQVGASRCHPDRRRGGWAGAVCPLTTLEMRLRAKAGAETYAGSFIGHWLQRILYYDAPPWVFTLGYTIFGLVVVATWWYFPPNSVAETMNPMPDPQPIGHFASGRLRANPLLASEVPALQAFFEENPEYFLAVNGVPPRPSEAQDEFDDLPPADIPFNERWLIGFTDPTGKLVGFAGVLSDILAALVWHIGIFIVASSLHGTGAALTLFDTLERWMKANGAAWIRLGVVEGNLKAERFWHKTGIAKYASGLASKWAVARTTFGSSSSRWVPARSQTTCPLSNETIPIQNGHDESDRSTSPGFVSLARHGTETVAVRQPQERGVVGSRPRVCTFACRRHARLTDSLVRRKRVFGPIRRHTFANLLGMDRTRIPYGRGRCAH
jgi:GNAT superfamily N-acetyltransferase